MASMRQHLKSVAAEVELIGRHSLEMASVELETVVVGLELLAMERNLSVMTVVEM